MAQKKILITAAFGTAFFAAVFFAPFAPLVHSASAATLYLSPSSGTYFTGTTFRVGIFVSSPDAPMNAAQGQLSFPTDALEVLSISKANSVMNLWVQEPSFSNQDGTVNFGGVVVNPGFEGSGGRILTVTFQVKNPGDAPISFVSGSVLANDGKGTNILTGMQGADMTLQTPPPGSVSIPRTGVGPNGTLTNPIIRTDPVITDGRWYSINNVTFNWDLPTDATAVSFAISNNPDFPLPDSPQPLSSETSYDLTKFSDGTWYFFLSFEESGVWTAAAVKAVQLDRTPPEPFTIVPEDPTIADTQPVFRWSAIDKTSGIAYYQAKIGNGDWFDPATIKEGPFYVLPQQSPAEDRTLTVRAYDNAGNFQGSSIFFDVGPVSGWHLWLRSLQAALVAWGWLIGFIAVLLASLSCFFIFHLLKWKKQVQRDLQRLRGHLGKDPKEDNK